MKCLRCGQCCYFMDEKSIIRPCRFLEQKGMRTKCMIFDRRLGAVIYRYPGTNLVGVCLKRKDTPYDFPGCPLNTDKPFPPWVSPPPKNKSI